MMIWIIVFRWLNRSGGKKSIVSLGITIRRDLSVYLTSSIKEMISYLLRMIIWWS